MNSQDYTSERNNIELYSAFVGAQMFLPLKIIRCHFLKTDTLNLLFQSITSQYGQHNVASNIFGSNLIVMCVASATFQMVQIKLLPIHPANTTKTDSPKMFINTHTYRHKFVVIVKFVFPFCTLISWTYAQTPFIFIEEHKHVMDCC